MKKKKHKYLIIIIIIIILIVHKLQTISKEQEDIIFFKLFNQKSYEKNNEIIYDLASDKVLDKKVNLVDTINNRYLVNEKIAPGTRGHFIIRIKTNKEIKYKISFKDENAKPQNLVFYIGNSERYYRNIEELSEELIGRLKKNEENDVIINWKWNYYQGQESDIQDTKDGMKIRQYNFKIYLIVTS